MKKLLALFTVSLLAGLVFASPSPNTGQLKGSFSYDWVSSPYVTNFVIYWGPATGTYTNFCNIGTNQVFTITNLVRGAKYWLAATAQYDAGNVIIESDYSNESNPTVPMKPIKPTQFIAQ